jgi:hypothetical protein
VEEEGVGCILIDVHGVEGECGCSGSRERGDFGSQERVKISYRNWGQEREENTARILESEIILS